MITVAQEHLIDDGNKQIIVADQKVGLCPSCNLFDTGGEFCEYCVPKPINKLYHKTKEYKVLEYLQTNLINELGARKLIHNKSVGSECTNSHLYPDFRIDCDHYNLIIEVDEHEHKSGNYNCEEKRMYDIVANLGMRCVFIRYNPDNEKSDLKVLLETVKKYLDISVDNFNIPWDHKNFIVVYLFYSAVNEKKIRKKDVDFDTILKEINSVTTVQNKKKFFCQECNFQSDSRGGYDKHIQTDKHILRVNQKEKEGQELKKVKAFPCPSCTLSFSQGAGLSRHKKMCHGKDDTKVKHLTNFYETTLKAMNEEIKSYKERIREHQDKLEKNNDRCTQTLKEKYDALRNIRDDNNVEINKLRDETIVLLNEKDVEINKLRDETRVLLNEKDVEIKKLMNGTIMLLNKKDVRIKKIRDKTKILLNDKDIEIKKLEDETRISLREKNNEIIRIISLYGAKMIEMKENYYSLR
ncbi:MAG: hypothetical protein Harvfovirus6_23 [Harvfovirus sp.]|uniref:C2H2-type domain-containing protein n=1 Tax=Harvfovirus sp. TaxID=2487768 RepID=A0A3G5A4M5_9VIRU|nr:MAG: hypothetical protein Harvfovirus6_23 [Harvfovirus sp.]